MSRSTCSWRIGARRVHDVVAFLATAEAAVGTIGPGSSAPVLLCTILFVAWGSGTGPALLAAALGALVLNFLLLQSSYSLTFQRRNLPPLALFCNAPIFAIYNRPLIDEWPISLTAALSNMGCCETRKKMRRASKTPIQGAAEKVWLLDRSCVQRSTVFHVGCPRRPEQQDRHFERTRGAPL